MFIGTFGAIKQKKIKRLIAYSGIAHVGYMLIGIGTGTIESIEAMLIYIIAYIAITINMFGILLSIAKEKTQETIKGDIYRTNK
jgi:NADH-quinone oxidoreductase subunit N